MAKPVLTEENKVFIAENYLLMSGQDLGKIIGCSEGPVNAYKRSAGLVVPIEVSRSFTANKRKGVTRSTPAQDEYIKSNYLVYPIKKLADMMGFSHTLICSRMKAMGLVVPDDLIALRKEQGRIKPGNVPKNKGKKQSDYMSPEAIARTASTRFQKGNINHNSKYDGAISIRQEHPDRNEGRFIKYIRISKSNWKELQIYNWEKINGPVPKGSILTCLDGDTLNCDPKNWKVITKAENAIRNAGHTNLPDIYIAGLIARNGRKVNQELRQELLQHPELLNIKRHQIKLQREIKNGRKQKK